jgi:Cys-tRNA(Pro)/Cys-tRNA(Cys) deacylase
MLVMSFTIRGESCRIVSEMSESLPSTPAILALEAAGVPHAVVRTERASSAEESAAFQRIELHQLLRTIVVRRAAEDFLFVLVPGGRRFDWPKLRALLGVSRMSLPDADEAQAVTGYPRGAITPFGSTHAWPVIADASIADLPLVAIGGGAWGVNIHLTPEALIAATGAQLADVTIPERHDHDH